MVIDLKYELLFDLLELVELLSELVDRVLLLLAGGGQLGVALKLQFLEVASELDKLSLAFLVNIDLHGE